MGRAGGYDLFMRMHEHITVAHTQLTPENARTEIERVLASCVHESLPVYINIPEDVQACEACGPTAQPVPRAPSDADALAQAVRLIVDWCVAVAHA